MKHWNRLIKLVLSSAVALITIVLLFLLAPFFDSSFSAHMFFHVLLIYLLAPTLLTGYFGLWLLPKSLRVQLLQRPLPLRNILSKLTNPPVAFILSTADLWFWHVPLFYDATLQNDFLHVVEHISFLIVFLFYWSPLVSTPLGLPQLNTNESRVFYLLAGAVQGSFLSSIITFSGQILYPYYSTVSHLGGLTPLADQQLGGGIMWLIGAFAYCLAGMLILKKE